MGEEVGVKVTLRSEGRDGEVGAGVGIVGDAEETGGGEERAVIREMSSQKELPVIEKDE